MLHVTEPEPSFVQPVIERLPERADRTRTRRR
jgi:hypothetical protein